MKTKGFTIIELLIVILLCAIILMAISGLYIASDKIFRHTRPISDVLEETRSGIVTLDFVFSRWGAGVPCENNTCNISNTTIPCLNYPPSAPMCITCNNGDFNSGCNDIEFYASLYGIGFVVNVNGTQANIISCRLTNDDYYYIWQGEKVLNYNATSTPAIYQLSGLAPDDQDCIKNFNGPPNAKSNSVVTLVSNSSYTYTLQPGDIIMRVPHKVRIYEDCKTNECWLYIEKTDMANSTKEPEKRIIAKLKDGSSFKVYKEGKVLRLEIEFESQSFPKKTLKIERYFAR